MSNRTEQGVATALETVQDPAPRRADRDRPLLELRGLKTSFFGDAGEVRALDGVDLVIRRGEVHGIVGESGCGKSVTARSILRILGARGRITAGEILFHGADSSDTVDLAAEPEEGSVLQKIRGNAISMIFQEPMTAFSPVYTIGNQIIEAVQLHQDLDDQAARELAVGMLKRVGLPQAEQLVDQYPFELSGGMRQRAMIAMALVCRPAILIADEPTTALDVTIQAQILDLMLELQRDFGMSIIMITHDLGVIAEVTDRVSVMYLGKVVEEAPVEEIFHNPKHPYTRALLESIPRIDEKATGDLATITGAVPDAYSTPRGCAFHPRCPRFIPGRCDVRAIEMTALTDDRRVRCVLYEHEESADE